MDHGELEWARQHVYKKVRFLAASLDAFPHITSDGSWLCSEHGRWTAGFFVGLQWLDYLETGHAGAKESALRWLPRLSSRQTDCTTHDMGFLFGPSAVLGYRITGDVKMAEMAVSAARSLATRYFAPARLVKAWDDPGYDGISIVDTIMNLPLLIWAADYAHESRLADIAMETAHQIYSEFVRPDGSTYHTVTFDESSGRIVAHGTHQGYAPDSCWSRGQAWALYGFANMYRYTNDEHYLQAASKLADYFIAHLPADRVPLWDFVFSDESDATVEPKDSAAGAIASSGLFLLGQLLTDVHSGNDRERGQIYISEATRILEALTRKYLYRDLHKYGVLLHATVDKPRNSGVDESCIYGDYYYAEALYRFGHLVNGDPAVDLLY